MSRFLLDSAGERWNTGSAELLLQHPFGLHTLQTAVWCRADSAETPVLALLDTGSAHTIIGEDLADELLDAYGGSVRDVGNLVCRFGSLKLWALTMTLTLINDSTHGYDMNLEVEARLAPDLPLPLVVGVDGVLDHVRMALDPGVRPGEARWYFGPVGGL